MNREEQQSRRKMYSHKQVPRQAERYASIYILFPARGIPDGIRFEKKKRRKKETNKERKEGKIKKEGKN